MTLLARLIAQREGFNVPGSLPNRQNNPGDLRHAPGEMHDPNAPDAIGSFINPADGWFALERQLKLYAERGLTIAGAIDEYAPPSDSNDTTEYLNFICQGLGLPPTALVSDALTIP